MKELFPTISEKDIEALRKAYNIAKEAGEEQFTFKGYAVLTKYAMYVLQYLDIKK